MDTAKLQQCTVLYSATATARNIVRVLVPEKKLLAGMYLEDLEKSFGIESVNAIIGKNEKKSIRERYNFLTS